MDGADLAEENAIALAKRLTKETGKMHVAHDDHFMSLVGGADWWEVRRYYFWIFYEVVASWWSPDGEVRTAFVERI